MSCKPLWLDFTLVRNEGGERYTGDGILNSAGNEHGFLSSVSYPHRAADLYKQTALHRKEKWFVLNNYYLFCMPVVIPKLIYYIYSYISIKIAVFLVINVSR